MPPLDELDATSAQIEPKAAKLSAFAPVYPRFSAPEPTKPKRAPVQDRRHERKVRRGQAEISATLDLHGHTQASAHATLVSFLSSQRRAGAKCVLVITGKGKLGEGILRRQLVHWLASDEAKALVNGYSEAHQKHGGSGAWYLFLRKTAPKP